MSESGLARKRCVPCDGNTPTLDPAEVVRLSAEVPDWRVDEGRRLVRSIRFRDFAGPVRLATRIAEVAEAEGHHPDLHIHWGRLDVEITTHAVKGLTENDFILAAKVDELLRSGAAGGHLQAPRSGRQR